MASLLRHHRLTTLGSRTASRVSRAAFSTNTNVDEVEANDDLQRRFPGVVQARKEGRLGSYGGSVGLRAGQGGRGSHTGRKVTVFGATGMLGRKVVQALANSGDTVVVPYRGDCMEVRHLKIMGDYGKVATVQYFQKDFESIRSACRGSDVVINLIGQTHDTKHIFPWMINSTLRDAHVITARAVAEAAVMEGVPRMIHTSALAAHPAAPSEWARTKFDGEDMVKSVIPQATIVRPATMYGSEDRFLNEYALMGRRLPRVLLVNGGTALQQPIFVNDVAYAIASIVDDADNHRETLGSTYSLAGPTVYTTRQIVDYIYRETQQNPKIWDVPEFAMSALGHVVNNFPKPLITADMAKLKASDVVLDADDSFNSNVKVIQDLGVEPVTMESISWEWLHSYREGGHFLAVAGSDFDSKRSDVVA